MGRWEELKDTEDVEELRRFIQRRPDDLEASEARARIVAIEYRQAKETGTRYAFACFVERHPDTSEALQARRHLERLDFEAAVASGDEHSLQAFLRAHPGGALADEAQAALERLLCERALAQGERAALERLLGARPDIACRARLDEALKRLRHAEALASTSLRPSLEFVAAYPEDPLARELRARLWAAELELWLRAGRFESARERVVALADASHAGALEARLAAARDAWTRAEFGGAGRGPGERAYLRVMAEATRLLRAEGPPTPPALEREGDPRARWLQASALGTRPDEASADALLEALGDAYLGVREAAWTALAGLLPRLEPARAELWLANRQLALARTARSGVLLLRLAALAELAGDPTGAERLLERLLAEQDPPDLFCLRRAHALAAARGDSLRAANLASRFGDSAADFWRRRREGWAQAGAGMRDSQEGFLVLRQLHGLATLWRAVLASYARPDAPLEAHASTLGPWLERSRAELRELATWLADEEGRWQRSHPGYLPGDAPAPAEAGHALAPALVRAVIALSLAGGSRAAPTLDQAACCAARPELRLLVAASRASASLARLAGVPAGPP